MNRMKNNKRNKHSITIGRWCLVVVLGLVLPVLLGLPNGVARETYIETRYADLFRVEYKKAGVKKVIDGAGRSLLLVPRGASIPACCKNLPKIEIPVRRVALESTIYAAFLNRLGVRKSIAGVSGHMAECHIKWLKKSVESGEITYLGRSAPMDYERVKLLNPDVVFAGSWDAKLIPKLNDLHIPVAIINCFQEKHPVGKMEWIKFLAAFYGKETEARKIIKTAVANIKAISAKIATAEKHPKVLSGGLYNGKVHVPMGNSVTAKMIAISGGDYVFKHLRLKEFMGGYGSITLEEFFSQAETSDIYLLETSAVYGISSVEKLVSTSELFTEITPVKNGSIWCTRPKYWESIDKMDAIIHDLAAIIHPELFFDHQPKYFYKLPKK